MLFGCIWIISLLNLMLFGAAVIESGIWVLLLYWARAKRFGVILSCYRDELKSFL